MAPKTYTNDEAIAHANLLAQQVKAEAQAELESLQEQAIMQVAAKNLTIEQKEEDNLLIRQASQHRAFQQREAELMSQLQHNCSHVEGQVAGYVRQQQEDSAQLSNQERLLHEKQAQAHDLQARLDQLQTQHAISLAAHAGRQDDKQEDIQARLVAFESNIRSRVSQEAHEAQTLVRQQAQQQIDTMNHQVIEKTNELALQQEHSRRALAEQQKLARLRDIEYEHLRTRLQEAEEVARLAKPVIEVTVVEATQVDPPTPTVTEATLVSTGVPVQPSPPTPRVPEPPSPGLELIFQEEEKGIEIFSPPKKRPATPSPSPVSFAAEGAAYPPINHGPAGSHSRTSSAGLPHKRGRDPTKTRADAAAVPPAETSPTSVSRFISHHLTPALTDSPLQDRSTGVKKSKPSGNETDEGNTVAQDLSEQFESLADPMIEPPVFPQ